MAVLREPLGRGRGSQAPRQTCVDAAGPLTGERDAGEPSCSLTPRGGAATGTWNGTPLEGPRVGTVFSPRAAGWGQGGGRDCKATAPRGCPVPGNMLVGSGRVASSQRLGDGRGGSCRLSGAQAEAGTLLPALRVGTHCWAAAALTCAPGPGGVHPPSSTERPTGDTGSTELRGPSPCHCVSSKRDEVGPGRTGFSPEGAVPLSASPAEPVASLELGSRGLCVLGPTSICPQPEAHLVTFASPSPGCTMAATGLERFRSLSVTSETVSTRRPVSGCSCGVQGWFPPRLLDLANHTRLGVTVCPERSRSPSCRCATRGPFLPRPPGEVVCLLQFTRGPGWAGRPPALRLSPTECVGGSGFPSPCAKEKNLFSAT